MKTSKSNNESRLNLHSYVLIENVTSKLSRDYEKRKKTFR